MAAKRVLMVVSNPSKNGLGWPVGFWGCELTHPFFEFTQAGYEVDVVSPKGGKVELDSWSDPRNKEGYEQKDVVTMGFLNVKEYAAILENTRKLSDVRVADYDALFICGGQAPMFTFREDRELHAAIRSAWEAGKVVAAICHGVASLLDVKLSDGKPLIAGKRMTGFSNIEELEMDKIVGKKVNPFHIEDVARQVGANFVNEGLWAPYATRDGNLITGQQSYSALVTARLLIEKLGL